MQYFDQELLNGSIQKHPLLGEYTINKMDTLGYYMIKTELGDFLLYLGNTLELSSGVYNFIAGYQHPTLKNTHILFFEWDAILDSIFLMLSPGGTKYPSVAKPVKSTFAKEVPN